MIQYVLELAGWILGAYMAGCVIGAFLRNLSGNKTKSGV